MPKHKTFPSRLFKPYPKSTFYDQIKQVQTDARERVRSLLTKNCNRQTASDVSIASSSISPLEPPLCHHVGLNTNTPVPMQDITNTSTSQSSQFRPIYPGAQVNQHESMLMTMKLASRPDVTMTTLSFILDYVRTHMPSSVEDYGNIEHLKSVYKFKQTCLNASRTKLHHVCPKCSYLFKDGEETCVTSTKQGKCDGKRWVNNGNSRQPAAFFIEMDAAHQIQEFFKDPAFVRDIMTYRQSFPDDDTIRDIFHGSLYKENREFLSQPFNLSLLWHTDGVSVYKSSDMQIWPVQAVINELPLRKRFSKNSTVLFGLWFGQSKPNMNNYLTPIVQTLENMYKIGFPIEVNDGTTQCHVLALACTMDLPAMSAVKEVHQFNGTFGCGLCEHEGQHISRKHGKCRIYPYTQNLRLRTHTSILKQGREALQNGGKKAVKGVKGLSVVMLIPRCNIATHFLLDHMHGVCLGVVKRLMECWFNSVNANTFCIKSRIPDVDGTLLAIHPPTDIRRPPQTVRRFCKYKASECMYFLLFYSIHALKGILAEILYVHLCMLCRGVYLLMTDRITKEDISEAGELLQKWLMYLEKLYGPEQCTMNAHNVGVHLVQSVELGGPLYTHGCFGFESRCGDYSRMVTSTRHPAQQIASAITINQDLRNKLNEVPSQHLNPTVAKLMTRDKRNTTEIDENYMRIGACKKHTLTEMEQVAVRKHLPTLATADVHQYRRIESRIGGMVYEGHPRKETKVYCDQHAKYVNQEGRDLYGTIQTFYQVHDHQGVTHHLAMVKPFLHYPEAGFMEGVCNNTSRHFGIKSVSDLCRHFTPVKISNRLRAIPVRNLKNKLVFLPGDTTRTWGNVVELPYNFEHN